jgi:hypothetical protein
VGYVLAGEPAGEDIHRLDCGPVDGRDVAEVRDAWVAVLEDSAGGRVDLGMPRHLAVEHRPDAFVEHPGAGEQ